MSICHRSISLDMLNDLTELVTELNDEIIGPDYPYKYSTEFKLCYTVYGDAGIHCWIEFLGQSIWNDESDEGNFEEDERERMDTFLRRKANDRLELVRGFKMRKESKLF